MSSLIWIRRCKVVVYLDEGMQDRCLFGRGDARSLFIWTRGCMVVVYLDEWMPGRCLFGRVDAWSLFIWTRGCKIAVYLDEGCLFGLRRCKVVIYLDVGMQERCLFGRGEDTRLFFFIWTEKMQCHPFLKSWDTCLPFFESGLQGFSKKGCRVHLDKGCNDVF
jgi:hypothetical protein